jgi:hypothetical protein
MLASVLSSGFATKPPRAFRDLIAARLREDQECLPVTPAISGKPETYFRASALGQVCGRAVALQIVNRLKIRGDLDPATLHLFAKGRAYHRMHQEDILPVIADRGLLGWWRSPHGSVHGNNPDGTPMLWTAKSASEELGVPARFLQYVEATCFNHDLMLRGHPDAIIDWGALDFSHPDHHGGREIVELKSRHDSDWMWNAVDPEMGGKPLDSHVLQVEAYMLLTGIDHARIIYMKKGDDELSEGLHASYAEWRVTANPGKAEAIRKYLIAYHELVAKAHIEKAVPKNTRCADFTKGMAAKCPMRHPCFNKVPKKISDKVVPMSHDDLYAMDNKVLEFFDSIPSLTETV